MAHGAKPANHRDELSYLQAERASTGSIREHGPIDSAWRPWRFRTVEEEIQTQHFLGAVNVRRNGVCSSQVIRIFQDDNSLPKTSSTRSLWISAASFLASSMIVRLLAGNGTASSSGSNLNVAEYLRDGDREVDLCREKTVSLLPVIT